MSGSMSRNKGQRAEREVIAYLQPIVDRTYAEAGRIAPVLQRNLLQSHLGGFDIYGLEWVAIEVKHCETFNLKQWWEQAKLQAKTGHPVLLYRKNNTQFRCRMYGWLPVGKENKVTTVVDVSMEAFLLWFELQLRYTMGLQVLR